MKKVAVSGYFDPLHVGHLDLFENARQLGDYLIVIVNTDEQARQKKGYVFMSCEDRMRIVSAIKGVDEVVKSVDTDRTICKTLERVKPDIFANGGDRHNKEIPESKVCQEYGIEIVDGLGAKIRSSSDLVGRSKKKKQ
jgi:D-beta-D-heptose 7-phosphate kinase/D-beta-D-heptose 1-phosphate adenosyltransferase